MPRGYMICRELIEICAACRERYVNIAERDSEIIVYADLMKEMFDTAMKHIVESHVAKCAHEIASAVAARAERHEWQEVGGKMRFFYVVRRCS